QCRTPRAIPMKQYFRIRFCVKHTAERAQCRSKLEIVVNLAIVDDHQPPVRRGHRLAAVDEIDDAQAPRAEKERAVGPKGSLVRSTMVKVVDEIVPEFGVRCRSVRREDADNATHGARYCDVRTRRTR